MERRTFLTAAAAATAVPLLRPTSSLAAPASSGLVDTNVYLSPWTVRHARPDTPARVVEKLRQHGVTSAWAGSFEGALHTDIAGANARLADACAREGKGLLLPFGTINPTFPDWEEDLRRCHEVHGMRGLRLFPGYHGYALDDARFARLVELAAQRGLLLQIVVSIEDERSQSPILTVPPVQPAPLPDLLEKVRNVRVMLLNGGSRILGANNPLLARLTAARVSFDLATLEGVGGIGALLERRPDVRLSFGSHLPYFYFEAALLKLQESELSQEQLAAITRGHALAALGS